MGTQFKGFKLLFDLETLCVLSEIYIDFTRKKKWSKSQKVSDILRFEIFLDLRFCHDLTHENGRNSLNFLDRGLIFWIFSYLYVLKVLIKDAPYSVWKGLIPCIKWKSPSHKEYFLD